MSKQSVKGSFASLEGSNIGKRLPYSNVKIWPFHPRNLKSIPTNGLKSYPNVIQMGQEYPIPVAITKVLRKSIYDAT